MSNHNLGNPYQKKGPMDPYTAADQPHNQSSSGIELHESILNRNLNQPLQMNRMKKVALSSLINSHRQEDRNKVGSS
jgi:hypothetical protein